LTVVTAHFAEADVHLVRESVIPAILVRRAAYSGSRNRRADHRDRRAQCGDADGAAALRTELLPPMVDPAAAPRAGKMDQSWLVLVAPTPTTASPKTATTARGGTCERAAFDTTARRRSTRSKAGL